MSDYIKREDALKVFDTDSMIKAWHMTEHIPSVDVAPVRHGRWEVVDAEEPRRYGCSECKRLSWHMDNYCPNCGAKMDEEE